jgi:uncharacterized protein YbjQ (UPF0145 family)
LQKILALCWVLLLGHAQLMEFLLGAYRHFFGWNITIYTDLCEQARSDTYILMREHAEKHDAYAIIAMLYDATELMSGLREVLRYGTVVCVEPE